MHKNTDLTSQLSSVDFMDRPAKTGLKVTLRAVRSIMRSATLMEPQKPAAAAALRRVARHAIEIIREAVWAANTTLSLARGEQALTGYYAEHELRRPQWAKRDEWLSSVFEALRAGRWLHRLSQGVSCYVGRAARNLHTREYRHGGLPHYSDALYAVPDRGSTDDKALGIDYHDQRRCTVSLEEVVDTPVEAISERRVTIASVEALQAAAAADPELEAYTSGVVRDPFRKRSELWHELGWTDKKGKSVDRRFRRLRERVLESGAGMEDVVVPASNMTTDAACTSFFDVLHDGRHGKGTGIYQHRPPEIPTVN